MKKKYLEIIDEAISDIVAKEKESYPPGYTEDERNRYRNRNLKKRAKTLRIIVNECGLDNGRKKILDVGPSEGIIPRALHNMSHDVHVLEHIGLYGKIENKDKYDKYYQPLPVEYCVLEKGHFPYPDDCFDLVTNFGVLEHIEPPTCHFWNEIYRVTKKSGKIFIDNPNPLNLRKRIWTIFGVNPNNEIKGWLNQQPIFTGHLREHTLDELAYSAEQSGFNLLKKGGISLFTEEFLGNASFVRRIFIYIYSLFLVTDRLRDTVYIVGRK